jgi:hypothetical protein
MLEAAVECTGVNISPQVASAIIAAVVSFVGVIVSVFSARWTIMAAREKLRSDAQALQQNLLKEVLAKRMAAYAAVWKVIITYDLNWSLEGKQADHPWITEFLHELNECNSDHGVFFSESVYTHFNEYRACLVEIAQRSKEGETIPPRDVLRLTALLRGEGRPGLSTVLKDDLGSYIWNIMQAGKPPTNS